MINKTHFFLLFLAITLAYSIPAKSTERVIDRPHWLYSTSDDLEIRKVTLTDSATILCFRVHCVYRPWTLSSSVHLEANGKSYGYQSGKLLTKKDGIVTESPFSPDSTNTSTHTVNGDRHFFDKDSLVLCFAPLPSDVHDFDFIEGKDRNSWKIFRIKLDGKPYPQLLPKQDEMPDTPLTAIVPKYGKAILKGRIYGYDPSIMSDNFGYFGNDYSLTANSFDFRNSIDSLGNFCFEGNISHPIPFNSIMSGFRMRTILVPGEVNELNLDIAANTSNGIFSTTREAFQFNGKYRAINEAVNEYFPYYASFVDYLKDILKLTFDEYVENIWNKYQETIKGIAENKSLNSQKREFLLLKAQAYYLKNRISYLEQIENGLYYSEIKKDSASFYKYQTQFTLKDPHSKELTIFKDLKALYVIYDYQLMDYMKTNGLTQNDVYRWMIELKKAKDLSARINTLHPVTNKDGWKGIAPQYLPSLQQLNDTILKQVRKLNQTASTSTVKEAPNVSADQLVQTLVSQYKGKVVLIDCWATWCGPCRTGITKMEPMKEELKGKDVVFVYLTNETSGATTWIKDIENMKGDHYRISTEQWNKLPNIKAIPHYLLFNKKGEQILDQVGWSDRLIEVFKTAILKALEE